MTKRLRVPFYNAENLGINFLSLQNRLKHHHSNFHSLVPEIITHQGNPKKWPTIWHDFYNLCEKKADYIIAINWSDFLFITIKPDKSHPDLLGN